MRRRFLGVAVVFGLLVGVVSGCCPCPVPVGTSSSLSLTTAAVPTEGGGVATARPVFKLAQRR